MWPKKIFLEIIYKIHRSTQFLALIPKMLFIWGKLGLFKVKIVGYESKNTINRGFGTMRLKFIYRAHFFGSLKVADLVEFFMSYRMVYNKSLLMVSFNRNQA